MEEKNILSIDEGHAVSRRGFVCTAAAVAASAALSACAPPKPASELVSSQASSGAAGSSSTAAASSAAASSASVSTAGADLFEDCDLVYGCCSPECQHHQLVG